MEVDQGGALGQDAVVIAIGDRIGNLHHVGVSLAGIHIVPDADHFCEEGDHIGGLAHRLAMGDLGFHLVQFGQCQAQTVDRGGKAEAGAGAVVAENGDRQTIVEDAPGLLFPVQQLQYLRHQHHGLEVVQAVLPGEEEILAEGVCVECFQFFQTSHYLIACGHVSPLFGRAIGQKGNRATGQADSRFACYRPSSFPLYSLLGFFFFMLFSLYSLSE